MSGAERTDWMVKHQLTKVVITLRLDEDGSWVLVATGEAPTKRSSLWSFAKSWAPHESRMVIAEDISILAHSVTLDRPRTREALDRSMQGDQSWTDQELPLQY